MYMHCLLYIHQLSRSLGQPSIIPCRPAHPSIGIDISKFWKGGEIEQIIVNGTSTDDSYEMKISSILSIVLLIAAVSMTTVSAWNAGDGGLSLWDNNCHFGTNFFTSKSSSAEQCGGVCIAQSGCTHFTQGNGVCYMWNAPNGRDVNHGNGWMCGYIPSRMTNGRR
uniref:Apple domain-containing protein n=1 Tax=Daphnia galeata TaxID=27404 RepID=A0A8J2WI50_9CRUS|nr:unnamed protein product [Daphnia galeata]